MGRYRLAVAFGFAMAAFIGPADAMSCRGGQAQYLQRDTGFTAALVSAGSHGTAASDLFFVVRSKAHSYWFRFQASNGYDGIYLEPISDPAKAKSEDGPQPLFAASGEEEKEKPVPSSYAFIAYDADMTEIASSPQARGKAPPVIVLPDLGVALWYDAVALGSPKNREAMTRSAFLLHRCAPVKKSGKTGR